MSNNTNVLNVTKLSKHLKIAECEEHWDVHTTNKLLNTTPKANDVP